MSNKVLFGNDARNKLKAGIDVVAKTVSCTLGANGRNVVFNKWSRVPIVTNDGVSAAREVEPEDLGEAQGANLIKQVSERTNDEVGDGTTTSIVLAHSMITQGMELLNNKDLNINPMKLRREMIEGSKKVIAALQDSAIKETDREKLEQIATVSVESPEIGKVITDSIFDAGDDGIVYVNDSLTVGVTTEKVEGYHIPSGLVSVGLVTDLEKMECVLNNPVVLITDLPIHLDENFLSFLGQVTQKNKEILVVCDEFHPDVLKFAVRNRVSGQFKMALVKKPMQADYLEDIAALTGGFAMTGEKGKLKYKIEYLGSAKKVVAHQFYTVINEGAGMNGVRMIEDQLTVDGTKHIENLKAQYTAADNEVIKTKLKERVARLTENVHMLSVGEKTEAEQKYLRLKVDDAVAAVKAAREEGIVAGGGTALFNIASIFNGSVIDGELILARACLAPMRQIVENSGEDFGKVCHDIVQLSTDKTRNVGFDALKMKTIPDMFEAGIIDPVKVTRNAFMNASSFAALLLTIETVVIPNPEVNTVLPR